MNINHKWEDFLRNNANHTNPFLSNIQKQPDSPIEPTAPLEVPARSIMSPDEFSSRVSLLNISTQTKSLFLNTPVDIISLFHYVQVIPYIVPKEGIIKKQIIMEAITWNEADELYKSMKQLQDTSPVDVNIKIPPAFLLESPPKQYKYKFHISVGFSRKNFKKPSKCAFSHCIALTIRIWFDNKYNDTHIKIFNTGKIEIPGKFVSEYIERIQQTVTRLLWDALQLRIVQYTDEPVAFVNSNFGVPFVVDLEKFYQILTHKYHLDATLDVCKFHGIKCLFYYNKGVPDGEQTGRVESTDSQLSNKKLKSMTSKYMQVHFICYKTGKCLIAGKCSETVLFVVYHFFVRLFVQEYVHIYEDDRADDPLIKPANVKRPVKITFTRDYLAANDPGL